MARRHEIDLAICQGIILVEGIAEAMLLPELAKIVLHKYDKLPETLEDCGVSVINMNGIYFKHFMQLFADLDENGSRAFPCVVQAYGQRSPNRFKADPI